MTENEAKAVKFIENIKDHAVVTLDHIAKEEPNVSPLVYKGREEKANTILTMIEELKQYRAIGTLEELKTTMQYVRLAKAHRTVGKAIEECAKYEKIGTPEECKIAVEKQRPRKPINPDDDYGTFKCPNCNGLIFTEGRFETHKYCLLCGQKLDWRNEE